MKFLMIISMICGLQIANAKESRIVLTTKNNCVLSSQVTQKSMKDLKDCLIDKVTERKYKSYPLYLFIDSPGGSVYSGLEFIEFAKNIKNLHTVTKFSASMAAAIVQGLPGRRYVTGNTVFMFHRATGTFQGQFGIGEVESKLKLWKKIVLDMEKMQAKRIGITLKKYQSLRYNEWWLYGSDVTINNVGDEMANVSCSTKLMNEREQVEVQTFLGVIKYDISKCPLAN